MARKLAGGFDAFAGFWVDGMVVQEVEFLGGGLRPAFDESAIASVDSEGALGTQDFDWERVEEFVGEDDRRALRP